jgi:hypothetical protein
MSAANEDKAKEELLATIMLNQAVMKQAISGRSIYVCQICGALTTLLTSIHDAMEAMYILPHASYCTVASTFLISWDGVRLGKRTSLKMLKLVAARIAKLKPIGDPHETPSH